MAQSEEMEGRGYLEREGRGANFKVGGVVLCWSTRLSGLAGPVGREWPPFYSSLDLRFAFVSSRRKNRDPTTTPNPNPNPFFMSVLT